MQILLGLCTILLCCTIHSVHGGCQSNTRGCFQAKSMTLAATDPEMTHEMCAQKCSQLQANFTVGGISNAKVCYCSTAADFSGTTVDPGQCNVKCAGDPSEDGGNNINPMIKTIFDNICPCSCNSATCTYDPNGGFSSFDICVETCGGPSPPPPPPPGPPSPPGPPGPPSPPGPPHSSSSSSSTLDTGGIILIVFFVVLVVYFIAGALFLKYRRQETGWDIVPNRGFWSAIPGLIKEGFVFTFAKIRRREYQPL